MRWPAFGPMVLLVACWGQGEDQPGEPVGSFEATGLMVEQSCGNAIPAPDPIDLIFDLRAEAGGRAYWRRQGGQTFAGIQHDDEYTFTVSQSWMVVEPDRFRGYAGCSVTQKDVFKFVIHQVETDEADETELDADAGATAALMTLTGSQTTEIEPLLGADCRPAVVAYGGNFLSIPCRVEYVITGTGITVE